MAGKHRLGWLGPAIVIVGLLVGGLGVWFMIGAKPTPGVVIDEIEIEGGKLVLRAEGGGPRSFVELHDTHGMRWRALVPTYAGRKGVRAVALTPDAVSVRVVRDGGAEIFALSRRDASKLGGVRLAPDLVAADDPGAVMTLSDGSRSYEIVRATTATRLVAVDLRLGKMIWQRQLAHVPVDAGGVEGSHVWIDQGGRKRFFAVFSGKEDRSDERIGPPAQDGVPPPWPSPSNAGSGLQ